MVVACRSRQGRRADPARGAGQGGSVDRPQAGGCTAGTRGQQHQAGGVEGICIYIYVGRLEGATVRYLHFKKRCNDREGVITAEKVILHDFVLLLFFLFVLFQNEKSSLTKEITFIEYLILRIWFHINFLSFVVVADKYEVDEP